jgi:hypothetical protein
VAHRVGDGFELFADQVVPLPRALDLFRIASLPSPNPKENV